MISRRALEAVTAVLTGSFGLAVVISSLGNGIGWGNDGVDPGTFPFITGVIILAERKDSAAKLTALHLGVVAFFTKPFDGDQFLSAVRGALAMQVK